MRARVLMSMVAVVLAASLGVAAAIACTPQAYIQVDAPAYDPGDPVGVEGKLFEPNGRAILRLGSQGPVVIDARANADGYWAGSFTLPAELKRGTYFLLAEVRGSEGQLVRTATTALPVRGAPAPASPPEREVRDQPRGPQSTPAPGEVPAPVTPEAVPVPPSTVPAGELPDTRTPTISFADAPLERLSLDGPAEPGAARALPVARVTAEAAERDDLRLPLIAIALSLLIGGLVGLLSGRRRPPAAQPVVVAPQPPDPMEAALQELIAEERSRELDQREHERV